LGLKPNFWHRAAVPTLEKKEIPATGGDSIFIVEPMVGRD